MDRNEFDRLWDDLIEAGVVNPIFRRARAALWPEQLGRACGCCHLFSRNLIIFIMRLHITVLLDRCGEEVKGFLDLAGAKR